MQCKIKSSTHVSDSSAVSVLSIFLLLPSTCTSYPVAMCHQKLQEPLVAFLAITLSTGSALVLPVRAFQYGPGDNVLDAATFAITIAAGIPFQGLEPLQM